MAKLLIRDIPEVLVLALEERAAATDRTAEAEHRLSLEEALRSDRNEFRKRGRTPARPDRQQDPG